MDLKNLFNNKKKYLDFFFENVDVNQAQKILDILNNSKKNIIFTGVGKSGFIANKVAMTMLSTGTKAIYLPVTDALHGDIGIVCEGDIFIVFSKSGETDELMNLIPFVKKRKATVISVISNKNSRLEKISDEFIYLPLERELCPYNLAPTTSTCIQLIFGDILTVALMKKHNFSLNDYAINHPAGAIGKQITLKVEDLMIKDDNIPICRKDDLIKDVLHVLSSKKCGCLLVADENENLLGIFTDGDLRRIIDLDPMSFLNKKMHEIMAKEPIVIEKSDLAINAMKKMEEKKQITVIPVVEKRKVVGLIRMHDIVQAGLSSLSL
ncbi:MAG: KpsF/GutQ family sugar-phosphate isomerase [Parachlamydiales bacterium]|nr:KpsF/GutQ family sugar-phosphate isomerase [Parachlamydiales bacterium]